MTINTGSRYEETVENIVASSAAGTARVTNDYAQHHACYFCREHITDEMKIVELTEQEPPKGTEQFYVHATCIAQYTTAH